MVQISSLGFSLQSIIQIKSAQAQLGDLSSQLATGKKSLDLSYYTLTESRRILDFRNVIDKRNSFVEAINTVQPRLNLYNNTFDSLDKLATNALAMVNTTQNAENADNEAVGEQILGFIDQVEYLLNQKMGDRYIFAGSRYTTAPVGDINALPVPPVDSSTPVTNPALPTYDSEAPGTSAASYTESTARIDENFTITYGVSSNEAGFQRLILGLRWAYAATQDTANFATNMNNARDLLSDALPDMRALHGEVISNISKCTNVKTLHNRFISEATTQMDDIQKADSALVATKITFVQAQLEASYSATAKIAQMTLTNYL